MNLNDPTDVRRSIYETLSEIANAFASPARLKVIQVLAQGSRRVEELSRETGESVANTSQHLQRLSKAGLVTCDRKGVTRVYRISSSLVLSLWENFQGLAHEIDSTLNDRENSLTDPTLRANEPAEKVLLAIKQGKAILIDVRNEQESSATPVKGASAIPLDKIKGAKHLKDLGLTKTKPIYAVCRGRYCSLASEAVKHLRNLGGVAYRLRESAFQLNVMSERG